MVDDHELFREGAMRLLDAEPDLEIAGSCASVDEALAFLRSTSVDLVLLDLDLGKERAFEFFDPAREIGFEGRVLVVAGMVGVFEARRLLNCGAAGIFLKQNSSHVLIEAIRAVIGGTTYIGPTLRHHMDSDPSPSIDELTAREQAVWNGVVEGLTNKEIARRVHISEALVKVTLQHLFDKHGVRTRSQLVRIALEQSRPES